MAVAPDHHLGARAVVGDEADQRVFERSHRSDLVDDPADLAIHPVDHRRVNGHLVRLESLLAVAQFGPRNGTGQLVGAELLVRFGKRIRRSDIPLDRGEGRAADPQFLHPIPSSVAKRIPAGEVGRLVFRDVLGRSLDREVGRGEGDIAEERLIFELRLMFFQAFNRMIGDRCARVVARCRIDGRERSTIFRVRLRPEVTVMVVEAVGVVESILQGLSIDVPLARVERAIADRPEVVGQEFRPFGTGALSAALDSGQGVASNLLGVVSGQDRRSRRPASGGVVEGREPETVLRQRIEVRRCDLAAVAREVGVAEVVGNDDHDVRPLCLAAVRGG